MNAKNRGILGLILFLISYLLFSGLVPNPDLPFDLRHWLNLIGVVLMLSLNDVFPKNRIGKIGSLLVFLGVLGHVGTNTIDFISWSFGDDVESRSQFWQHVQGIPTISIPFLIMAPSLFFIGFSIHVLNFIKTDIVQYLMVTIGGLMVGVSFFLFKNGLFVFIGCSLFVLGLIFLAYKENQMNISQPT